MCNDNELKVVCKPYVVNNDDKNYETIIKFSLTDGETVFCYDMELSRIRKYFNSDYEFPFSDAVITQ